MSSPLPYDGPALHRFAQEAVDAGVEWLAAEGAGTAWSRRRFKLSGEEVTDADVEVERRVTRVLADRTPEIPVVGEESADMGPVPDTCWLLDPIDGTMNFTRGAPGHAVSLACVMDGTPVLGVVHAPALARRWSTGAGSTEAAGLPGSRTLSGAVVGLTGTGSGRRRPARLIGRLYEVAHRIRLQGAMSLDLVGVAEGWLDACVCLDPSPWDVAAGVALVRERGGAVLGAGGRAFTLHSPVLAAGAEPVARELIALWESLDS
ncbi:inositol monophosphatase family protein [Streptomyces microflavus]|uniref:inositol monophosphatase family protein n=1 Tax=Streptomyces microflavus TaxID=1919 RepID=UPI002252A63F|nr:inositol monophosphatase family protein [Streptomyces microflavus]MCX4653035.1 inositol monophosphatase family protein [Streptomyces microflavus]